MSDPKIADTKPAVMELDAGDYWYCTCGQSANQPFCDGSHKGTSFTPLKFTIEEKKQVALCQCKHTGNAPFCDGSHAKL
ncbi:MAG: CDGSH iron-sulfur domain-containing protein [Cyanobacteria bacterium]|nr:CDGSH iron-sulfur domain-containing protein [Cyanobacteriota bacterium]MDA0867154.1 CDGSH iron-sulfur domain-containing protein [Cyanobacteriota bacterium]